MNKNPVFLLLVLSSVFFVFSGCANNEVIKKDESVVPVVTTAATNPEKQAVKKTQMEENVVQDAFKPVLNAGELEPVLENIYFAFDAYTLSSSARESLVRNSEILKRDPAVTVRIEGHTDERGSDAYNLALGEKRAGAAMKYMVTLGIPENRLSTISYGKEKPVEAGHDEASWAKNRRDEFMIRH